MFTGDEGSTPAPQLLYQTESRFEFFADKVTWQGDDRLILARSRFSSDTDLERNTFGLVQLQLPDELLAGTFSGASATDSLNISSYLLPNQDILLDFVGCLRGEFVLLISQDSAGNTIVSRWTGNNRPRPLFGLPIPLDRVHICRDASKIL